MANELSALLEVAGETVEENERRERSAPDENGKSDFRLDRERSDRHMKPG